MTANEALAALRTANVPRPGWHLRKLEAAGSDLAAMVERVCAGVPVHRVIGRREFHGLELEIGPDTLEPRDDTEALVGLVLDHLPDRPCYVADLGTGTGAVGLALLSERAPGVRCLMTDTSREALAVAKANAHALDLAHSAAFALGSWCEPLAGTFDAIVSNPPYIRSDVVPTLDASVRDHDPWLALDGGTDGLDAYRAILRDAAAHLRPDGFLALEIGYDQRAAIGALAGASGWRVVEVRADLEGRDRAVLLKPL